MSRNISIVINVYNEEDNIADCLESLKSQSLSDFELVIVDDGSTDSTMDIVDRYADDFRISKFRTEHVGIKKARLKGVSETSGDIVVVIDADEILEEEFLEEIVGPFEDDEVGAVGGTLKSEGDGWVTEGYGALNEIFYKLRAQGDEADWIQGGCSAYRKVALDEVGGLAREKVSADKDISWKLKDAGWKVVLNKDAVAYHRDPQTVGSVMKREFNIGKREYSLLKKHKNRFGWKEMSRFYPFGLILFGVLSPFWWIFGVLFLLGLIGTFGMVLYMVHSNLEGYGSFVSLKSWVVLTLINMAWSAGVIKALFS